MKIFESNKSEIKLFKIPIYTVKTDYETSSRTQKFLGGLVSTYRIIKDYTNYIEKSINIINLPLLKRIDDGQYRKYFFAGILIKKKSFIDNIKKQIKNRIDTKYDDIYILSANSGEIYLLLAYFIDALIKRNSSKAPLLIATKKYHCDIIKMLCPDIPYIYINSLGKKIGIPEFSIDNFRFFMLFEHAYFKKTESEIRFDNTFNTHYLTNMMKKCGLSENDISLRKMVIPEPAIQSLDKKLENINLDTDNFVFIAPEAQSCENINTKFWADLINNLKEQGYDVFLNLMQPFENKTCSFKTCFLTYSEAYALACKAKYIISLRSGFSEFLLQTNIKSFIIYTKFGKRSFYDDMTTQQVISGFNIKKLPFVNQNNIYEFAINENQTNSNDIRKEIISTVLKLDGVQA